MRLRARTKPVGGGGHSLNYLLPNALTTLAFAAGMTAILFAIERRWEAGVIAVLVAAILDTLDGAVARMLHGESKFGAQLDSLSDVVCFGVAPAIMLFLWTLNEAGRVGWVASLAYGVCTALRLARFNATLGEGGQKPYGPAYLVGVPSPAGAGLVLMPIIFASASDLPVSEHPYLVALWTAASALLMVSTLPTFSLKSIRVPHRLLVPVLAGLAITAAAVVSAPWGMLSLVIFTYAVSIPFTVRLYRRRVARELAAATEEGEDRSPIELRRPPLQNP